MKNYLIFLFIILFKTSYSQTKEIPSSFHNLQYKDGVLGVVNGEKFYPLKEKEVFLTYENFATPDVYPHSDGVELDFKNPQIEGTVYFGLIDDRSRYKQPIYSKVNAKIIKGKALLKISKLKGKYDFTGWEKSGEVRIGYRVTDKKGRILTENRLNILFDGKKFYPQPTLIEGPFLSKPRPDGITVYLAFNQPVRAKIKVDGKIWDNGKVKKKHVYNLGGLKPATQYHYEIVYDQWEEEFSFKTAPEKGYDQGFTFAYASDSRGGTAGGERNIYGTNAYILKRIMLAADKENVDFFLFTGDMISGYRTNKGQIRLEYFNFKNAVRYLSPYRPIYLGMGNHEALSHSFYKFDSESTQAWKRYISVDRFPFETESAEAVFAGEFEMPLNGPESEDGNKYDPSEKTKDFPSYKENVYWFTYGNAGFVMLNADYWYTTNENYIPLVGGNPHGYIMDNQLKWFEKTLQKLENDPAIDHIFVTIHITPFPNAGHSDDGMWYDGNNEIRPYIAGKPVEKGIIERRDEFVDLMVNHSKKFRALLVGDEHNYTRLVLDNDAEIYPENWKGKKLHFSRPFIQLTNGAAGAPYYALEDLPWKDHVKTFSTQNAIMIFHVKKESVKIRVYNPDTFEPIEEFELK